ncbi:MAG: adenylate/guanylate cyclase domain-containing protein [Elusimicrobia bacterium]|nr:adenylate/guanylate cyclase domain-containing protein [Elusimicrobiota bacterium]
MHPVTRHLTILFTDIKGFTDKTSQRSRSKIQELLDRHREIVLPVLEGRGGKLIKTIGDAFLMIFESPTDAVLAGVDVQEALARHNAEAPEDDRIEVRVYKVKKEQPVGEAKPTASLRGSGGSSGSCVLPRPRWRPPRRPGPWTPAGQAGPR